MTLPEAIDSTRLPRVAYRIGGGIFGARDRLSGVLLLPYATDGPSDVAQDWDDDRDTGSK
jgi:hypothetical protein